MRQLTIFLFLSIPFIYFGQQHQVGLKAGINWSNISGEDIPPNNSYRTGLATGITYDYTFSNSISVGVDVLYQQNGFRTKTELTNNWGITNGEEFLVKYNFDYISLPIKVGYSYGDKIFAFGNIKLIPALIASGKVTTPPINLFILSIPEQNVDIREDMNAFDLAGGIELGGGYKFMENLSAYLSFAYQHSFITMTNADFFEDSKLFNNGFMLSLGVKYGF